MVTVPVWSLAWLFVASFVAGAILGAWIIVVTGSGTIRRGE